MERGLVVKIILSLQKLWKVPYLRAALNKQAMKSPGSPGRPCSISITKYITICGKQTINISSWYLQFDLHKCTICQEQNTYCIISDVQNTLERHESNVMKGITIKYANTNAGVFCALRGTLFNSARIFLIILHISLQILFTPEKSMTVMQYSSWMDGWMDGNTKNITQHSATHCIP